MGIWDCPRLYREVVDMSLGYLGRSSMTINIYVRLTKYKSAKRPYEEKVELV
jgi:hypothetical protein